jgi:hypothetical protein
MKKCSKCDKIKCESEFYRSYCKICFKKYQKEHYQQNKDNKKWYGYDKNYQQQYRENNKDYFKEYEQQYHKKNKNKRKQYRKNNIEKRKEYWKRRRQIPEVRIINSIRACHRQVLKGKTNTTKGLGCDSKFLRKWIEQQWSEGMNWENYGNKIGKWSIDHILPITLFYTQPELLNKLIHYTNLRPMWHLDNLKKGNKI